MADRLFTWGDEVRIWEEARSELRPGAIASVCGVRETGATTSVFGVEFPRGTILYLVEFGDGSSVEIPEVWLYSTENTAPRILEKRVLSSLRPCLEQSLKSVAYWCLRDEAKSDDIRDPKFYLGGEVELCFENQRLIVTWDENAGWEHHFSVQCRTDSAFNAGTLESFDASALPIWSVAVATPLTAVSVLGWDGVPHVVRLEFPKTTVLIGAGSAGRFCDGDDVAVRSEIDADMPPKPEILWSSANDRDDDPRKSDEPGDRGIIQRLILKDKHVPTGKTRHLRGAEVIPKPHELRIVKFEGETGVYLIHFDRAGNELTDTFHSNIAEAMEQANWEFGVEESDWSTGDKG